MLPPELPAGGVSGDGGGGSGGSGDGRDSNSSPFASSGLGMLLKDLGFTNDKGESIGSPITNSKMKDVSSTSPTDIDLELEEKLLRQSVHYRHQMRPKTCGRIKVLRAKWRKQRSEKVLTLLLFMIGVMKKYMAFREHS